MQFVISGFVPDKGFRVFAFDSVGKDYMRTRFTVRADLSLIGKYGISMQELPLLLKEHLEAGMGGETGATLVFTEEAMRNCAGRRLALRNSARSKKPNRVRPEHTEDKWQGRPGTRGYTD